MSFLKEFGSDFAFVDRQKRIPVDGTVYKLDLLFYHRGLRRLTEHIEYLMLEEDSPVKVAKYYTKLPDKKLLSEKLQRAIAIAKEYQRNREVGKQSSSESVG